MDNEEYERNRSWSKDHKAKDKKKKKKHEDRSRSKSNKKRKDRDREQRDYDRYDEKQDRYRQKSKERKDKHSDKDRDRERDRGRDKDRERQRQRDRERWDQRYKQKSRDRQKQRERSRQKQKNRNQQDRQKQKQKQKQKERDNQEIVKQVRQQSHMKAQDQKISPQNDRSQKKKKKRSASEKKNKKQRKSYDRSRSRDKKKYLYQYNRKKKEYKNEYEKRRRRRDKSSSSSSSNRSGNVSDDPQQVQKLAQMKAAKELVSSKTDRKLYLGNLPPNITSQQLMDMLNGALKKMQINTDVEGDSIVSSWISPDGVGHYAFVEFRTAQEATNGLTLNGASLFGYQLKLGRPKQYIEYSKTLLSEMGTDKNLQTILKKVAALKGTDELPPIQDRIVCPPSKIIVLKHLVSIQELAIDEQYEQIKQDIMQMAKRFGTVKSVHIPRPHQVIDLEHVQKRVKGLGLIFVQYDTLGAGRFARSQFVLKEFSGKPVACSFFDEHKFKEQDFDIQQKVIIDF